MNYPTRLLAGLSTYLLIAGVGFSDLVTYSFSSSSGSLFDEFRPEGYVSLLDYETPVTLSLTFDTNRPGYVDPVYNQAAYTPVSAWASIGDTRFDSLETAELYIDYRDSGFSYLWYGSVSLADSFFFFGMSYGSVEPVEEPRLGLPFPLPPLLEQPFPYWTKLDAFESTVDGWLHYESIPDLASITAAPEPATYGMMGAAALLGLTFLRRRRGAAQRAR